MTKKEFRDSTSHLDRFFSAASEEQISLPYDAKVNMPDDTTSNILENMSDDMSYDITENISETREGESILSMVSQPVNKSKGSTQTHYLSDDVVEALNILSQKTGKSRSALVDEILRVVLIRGRK